MEFFERKYLTEMRAYFKKVFYTYCTVMFTIYTASFLYLIKGCHIMQLSVMPMAIHLAWMFLLYLIMIWRYTFGFAKNIRVEYRKYLKYHLTNEL